MGKPLMCPKCGEIDARPQCSFCNTAKIDINIDGDELLECTSEGRKLFEQRIHRKHLFNLPTFDEDAYESRLKKYQELEARIRREVEQDKLNTPKCPYCNSFYVEKITTGGRLLSTAMFGLGSSKVGKQWHCKQCGSNF